MASLLKVGGLIIGFAALLYAAATLLTLPAMPVETGSLDTGSVFSNRRAYGLEERYLVANVWGLGEPRDRVIILGSSSARLTFPSALLQPSLPGVETDNLSIEGANISETRNTLHLIYQAMPADWRGHTTFVLGVTYINFVENHFAFRGLNDNLTGELQRFGLYRKDAGGEFDARFPPAVMRSVALLTRPILVAPYFRRIITGILPGDLRMRLKLLLGKRTSPDDEMGRKFDAFDLGQSDATYDADVVSPDLQAWLLRATAIGLGGDHVLPPEQFLEFQRLAEEIEAHGDRLVIVDMPLPRWHIQGLPKHADSYREKMAAAMSRLLAQPSISYLDLRAFDDPDNFYDAAHPKPRVRKLLRVKTVDFLRDHA